MITSFGDEVLQFIPKLLLSVLILGIGYLLGKLVKFLVIKLMGYLNRLIQIWFKSNALQINLQRPANFIGNVFFWLIFLSFFILITDILGLSIIKDWMESILQYSPNILAAILIIVVAIFVGKILAGIISSVSKKVGLSYGNTLGRIAQLLVVFTAIIIAVDQIGIEISFLITLVNIVIAALLFGAALAFGLGARTVVTNILAAFYVRKMYRVGDQVQIGSTRGRIARIDPTSVLLDTEEGQVTIPAKVFNENQSILLKE
ncbi:MAG: mechanosensitive ion channel family protein [Candidatus Cyclobacteriaceae bacterium M3_2C_046]